MAYQVTKKPWLGALFVFFFGPFGFLYYSWKKALVVFLLFFIPISIIFNLDYHIVAWIIQICLAIYAYIDIKGRIDIIENFFSKIIPLTTIPLIFINFFGEIVGAIWLLFLGEWELVIFGFLFTWLIPYAYSIVSLVALPFSSLMLYAEKKNKKTLYLASGFVSMFIGHLIILFYVFYIANKAIIIAEFENINIIALLLFGYGVATGPFSYMASKEPPDAIGSYIAVYITELSFIIIAITYLLNHVQIAIPIILMITFGLEIYLFSLTSKMFKYK